MIARKKMKNTLFYAFLAVFALSLTSNAQNDIKLTDIEPGYVEYAAFSLSGDAEITVSGTVAGFRKWGNRRKNIRKNIYLYVPYFCSISSLSSILFY